MDNRSKLESWWALALIALVFAGGIVGVAYLLGFVWPKVFDLDALQLLGANVLGVLLAAFFALETERSLGERRERRRQKQAQRERRERAVQALGALREAVDHNDELVSQAVDILDESAGDVVSFGTDPESFDPILPRVLDTTGDLDLVMEASNYRYQLEHFGRKLEAQLNLYLRPEFRPTGGKAGSDRMASNLALRRTRGEVVDSILDQGEVLQGTAEDLIESIEMARQERIE